MNNFLRWLWSLAAATLGATLAAAVYFSLRLGSSLGGGAAFSWIALAAFLIALGHVVCLGVPGSLLLWRLRKVTRHSMCLFGFLAGSLPLAITTWPLVSISRAADAAGLEGGATAGALATRAASLERWSFYGESVLTLGALGAIAGLAFWLAWDGWAFARDDEYG